MPCKFFGYRRGTPTGHVNRHCAASAQVYANPDDKLHGNQPKQKARASGDDACEQPVGAALFAGCSIGRIKIEEATKACLPFYAMMVLVLLLVTFCKPLSMFVPTLMMG